MVDNVKHSVACAALILTFPALADGVKLAGNAAPVRPDSHAPIGVMGDHVHNKGEWMISYRYMSMDMEDNLQGNDSISPEEIVTTIANPNTGPATLRVVPVEMTTDMHMFGLMYAPSDKVTLMAMINYLEKDMDHVSFAGMAGTNRRGLFTTESSGWGDTKLSALWSLYKSSGHKLHVNLGLSIPTGSIDERDAVLTPMGTRPTLRLPYAMQLGSGTYDLEPGVTYSGHTGKMAWGAQYRATLRLGENDEDYTWGDIHTITGWGSYRFTNWISASLRLSYRDEGRIDGMDTNIAAPVQTADPDNYGGERVDLGIGVNLAGQSGALRNQRLALEYVTPLEQDVNGVQMEMQSMLTLGYQYSF